MSVVIVLDDVAQMLGLKYLLNQYFDVEAVGVGDVDEVDGVDQLRLSLERHLTRPQSGAAPELSQREVEVLRLVAMGYINKEIADRLDISFNTVLSHRKNITAKLGIKSVSGLGVYALMNGIVAESDLSR